MLYFDWNATAPLRPEAFETMEPWLREHHGNPSSIHAAGRKARVALDEAREAVADLIGASERELVFTAGATEANNLAIQGVAAANPGATFVSTPVEHPSVLEPLAALEEQGRIVWKRFALTSEGAIADTGIGNDAAFVSVMAANNETGRVFPVADIARAAREAGALMHSDLTQAAGRIAVDVHAWGLDLASLSAHKIGGPKGVGAFFVRRGVTLEKVLFGGKQERSRRPGTENVPAIVGFGAAARAALRERESLHARLRELRVRLWTGIRGLGVPVELNTPLDESVPNTLNVSFVGNEGNFLLQRLDMAGLCVSSGAACASGSPEPSPVLLAMGMAEDRVRGAVRFSMGWATTADEVEQVLAVLRKVLLPRS